MINYDYWTTRQLKDITAKYSHIHGLELPLNVSRNELVGTLQRVVDEGIFKQDEITYASLLPYVKTYIKHASRMRKDALYIEFRRLVSDRFSDTIYPYEIVSVVDSKEIKRFVGTIRKNSHQMCGNEIGSDKYWNNLQTNTPDEALMIVDTTGDVKGFVLLRAKYCVSTHTIESKIPSIYVELICSHVRGLGSALLNYIKLRMRTMYSRSMIQLSALPHVISYYHKKHGFHIGITGTNSPNQRELIEVCERKHSIRKYIDMHVEHGIDYIQRQLTELNQVSKRLHDLFNEFDIQKMSYIYICIQQENVRPHHIESDGLIMTCIVEGNIK
jgi:hypothetical protein